MNKKRNNFIEKYLIVLSELSYKTCTSHKILSIGDSQKRAHSR